MACDPNMAYPSYLGERLSNDVLIFENDVSEYVSLHHHHQQLQNLNSLTQEQKNFIENSKNFWKNVPRQETEHQVKPQQRRVSEWETLIDKLQLPIGKLSAAETGPERGGSSSNP